MIYYIIYINMIYYDYGQNIAHDT